MKQGICSGCRYWLAVRKDGNMRKHSAYVWNDLLTRKTWHDPCPGSEKPQLLEKT